MSQTSAVGDGSFLPELLEANIALMIVEPVLNDFEVAADPLREPELFGQQVKRAHPRYEGDDVPFATRYTLENSTGGYHPRVERHILAAAGDLAMLNREVPFVPGTELEVVIALGAARIATENRLRFAAEAIRDGKITAHSAGVVTSGRPIKDRAEITAAGLTEEDFKVEEVDHPTEHNLGAEQSE
jgi:hypothetical protein